MPERYPTVSNAASQVSTNIVTLLWNFGFGNRTADVGVSPFGTPVGATTYLVANKPESFTGTLVEDGRGAYTVLGPSFTGSCFYGTPATIQTCFQAFSGSTAVVTNVPETFVATEGFVVPATTTVTVGRSSGSSVAPGHTA